MLADSMIQAFLNTGRLRIDGGPSFTENPDVLQPASYEVTLGALMLRPMVKDKLRRWFTDTGNLGYHVIEPGQFLLATTTERIALPSSLSARVDGKSSLARQGLMVHSTAGFIDPGFEGQITLELSNVGPWSLPLVAGQRIAQLTFEFMDGKVERPYGTESLRSHYQGQEGPTSAAL